MQRAKSIALQKRPPRAQKSSNKWQANELRCILRGSTSVTNEPEMSIIADNRLKSCCNSWWIIQLDYNECITVAHWGNIWKNRSHVFPWNAHRICNTYATSQNVFRKLEICSIRVWKKIFKQFTLVCVQ